MATNPQVEAFRATLNKHLGKPDWTDSKGNRHLFESVERKTYETFSRTLRGGFTLIDPVLMPYTEGVDKGSKDMQFDRDKTKALVFELDTDAEIDGDPKMVYSPNTPDETKFSVMIEKDGRRFSGYVRKKDLMKDIPAAIPGQLPLEPDETPPGSKEEVTEEGMPRTKVKPQIPEWATNDTQSIRLERYGSLQFYEEPLTTVEELERKRTGIDIRKKIPDGKTQGTIQIRLRETPEEYRKRKKDYYETVVVGPKDSPCLGLKGYVSKGGLFQALHDRKIDELWPTD
jgi:hypothetical protein